MVCLANVCRSPIAAALLRRELEERHVSELLRVESAGYLEEGRPAHPLSLQCLKRRGIDLREHRSSLLTPLRVHRAWKILAVEEALAARARALGAREAYTLSSWATHGEDSADIADPVGQRSFQAFESCAKRLEGLVPRAADRLCAELSEEVPEL